MTYIPRRRGSFSALALVFVLTACGDSTGPLLGTAIRISVASLDGPTMIEEVPGERRVRCVVTFRATAHGGERATWGDATFKFFVGPDRAAPVDTAVFPATEIRDSWGGTTLRDGQSADAQWIFESGAPFVVTAEYRYSPGGGSPVARANTRFACGPEPSANTPPPTITDVSLTVPWDGLEPGDPLMISYTANVPLGLWATAVELSGACESFMEFGERLQTTASRTLTVLVPADCVLNVPLQVTVYVADAALRLAWHVSPGPLLVDHTPPTIDVGFFPPNGGSLSTNIAGTYFVRDSIDLVIWANDNHRVRSIVYEILPSGHRDSVINTPTFGGRLRMPLPPEATGPVQLRLVARDSMGLTSAPYLTRPDSIRVYPTIDRPTIQTSFDGGVRDIVIDAARGAIYVSQSTAQIRVLSATTLETTRIISLPHYPWSFDVTPSGDSLIMAHWQGVDVVDLRQPTPVVSAIPLTLDASVNQQPTRVVVLGNGKAFVALGGNASRAHVLLELDLAAGELRVRADAADASGVADASWMQRSPDRLAVIFSGGSGRFRRYDATTDQFMLGDPVTVGYGGLLSLDRGGQHFNVTFNIFDASMTFLRRAETIYGNANVVPATSISADGEYLYVGGRRGVMRSRVSDGRLVDRTVNPVLADIFRVAGDDSFIVTSTSYGTAQLSLIRTR